LIGNKIIENHIDDRTLGEFQQAMNKVRSVLDNSDWHHLDIIDKDIMVNHVRVEPLSASADVWLRDCRTALSCLQPLSLDYKGRSGQDPTSRVVEPVGLYFYSHHWHLIAWCRFREDYRDFRLDHILSLRLLTEQFRRREYRDLQEYLQREPQYDSLHEIKLRFSTETAQFVDEQRY
jgi:predicted DNA-binding transcriptional regulator YafY